ncbi:hypothetical protein PG999_004434 [Apiospora kogelbergensis]|uniref:HIT domain-containing protein n=1 Tax=Apiospora kogelbergensis TaxID=1337665 RepID=A0AAW0QZ87_9PEZI
MPSPGTIYTSPLRRCLGTTKQIYNGVHQQNGLDPRRVIKENLQCSFESGFKEEDELWKPKPNDPEGEDKHTSRVKSVLEAIFNTDSSQFVLMGERSQMQYEFTNEQDVIAQQISQFWAHSQATGDVKAYLEGDEGHDYAKIDKWVQARTPFTDPPNEKLAENDEVFIIGNRASFDVAQYDKASSAGMSMIHLLALPRKRVYNGVSLNKENVYLIDNIIDLFKSSWKKAEFRNKVLAHQREAIENAKGSKGDEGYMLALKHYEELKSSIHQFQAENFKFGLHLFPDQSIPHLHMHIIAATKGMRKYSTSHHDQKTKDALECNLS